MIGRGADFIFENLQSAASFRGGFSFGLGGLADRRCIGKRDLRPTKTRLTARRKYET
jgi:hypothetical protein